MSWDSSWGDDGDEFTLPGPPVGLMVAVWIGNAAALVPLLWDSRTLSIVGYVASAWVVAAIAVLFREVDRRREGSPLYLPRPSIRRAVNLGALVGLLIGCVHAWRIAQETSYS